MTPQENLLQGARHQPQIKAKPRVSLIDQIKPGLAGDAAPAVNRVGFGRRGTGPQQPFFVPMNGKRCQPGDAGA